MEVMAHASTFLLPPPSPPSPPSGSNGHPLTYALVVLNQRLPSFAPLLWSHARLRVCADGGANRVYDEMPRIFPDQDPVDVRNRYKPDVIKGDMDSIRDDVKEFYSNLEVKIVDEADDQDTTDLHKCIAFICDNRPTLDKSNLCILVAGALGGRFDHEVGNINVLYRFSNIQGPHCGLIPAGAPSASTTTTGLKWNLNDTAMSFGGLISTSNIAVEEKITVRSDSDLLWTISIRHPNKKI